MPQVYRICIIRNYVLTGKPVFRTLYNFPEFLSVEGGLFGITHRLIHLVFYYIGIMKLQTELRDQIQRAPYFHNGHLHTHTGL